MTRSTAGSLAERDAVIWQVRRLPEPARRAGGPDDGTSGPPVLLVGLSHDVHLDLVAAELRRRGVASVRVDVDRLLGPSGSADRLPPAVAGPFRAMFCRATDPRRPLAHHGMRTAFVDRVVMDDASGNFASEQAERAVLDRLEDWVCGHRVNDWWTAHRAELRGRQLAAASAHGLDVPRGVTTNDPDEVRRLAATCPGGIVHKGLADPFVSMGATARFLYTSPLGVDDLADLGGTLRHPSRFEERLEAVAEYRVTVVGRRTFAVRINTSGDSVLDWRRNLHLGVGHRVVRLEPTVAAAVVDTVASLGLSFGAVDLLQTEDRLVFLEVNPSGAFSWLERATGLPITAALCDELLGVGPSAPGMDGDAAVRPRQESDPARSAEPRL